MLITVATRVFFLSLRCLHQFVGADGHDVVAVDDFAVFVADDQPVAVAVEGEADVGAQFLDLGGHYLRDAGRRIRG